MNYLRFFSYSLVLIALAGSLLSLFITVQLDSHLADREILIATFGYSALLVLLIYRRTISPLMYWISMVASAAWLVNIIMSRFGFVAGYRAFSSSEQNLTLLLWLMVSLGAYSGVISKGVEKKS